LEDYKSWLVRNGLDVGFSGQEGNRAATRVAQRLFETQR
jgi:hypothetical protein